MGGATEGAAPVELQNRVQPPLQGYGRTREQLFGGNLKFTTDPSKPRPQGGIGQVQLRETRQEELRHNRRGGNSKFTTEGLQGTQVQQKVRML